MGRHLETKHADRLDSLQLIMTKLCQNSKVDITIRLRLLEIIELKSFGWEVSPQVENYYKERFEQLASKQIEDSEKCNNTEYSINVNHGASKFVKRSILDKVPVVKECLEVNGVRMYLHSSNPASTAKAKKVLEDFFSQDSSLRPQVQYSRCEILGLASSPLSLLPPDRWEVMSKSLPSILLRSGNCTADGEGDRSNRLHPPVPPHNETCVLPNNLPVIKKE